VKSLLFVSLLLLLTTLGQAQWLETTVWLPDSLSGISYPNVFGYNETSNRVYVADGSNPWVIVLDALTGEKIARAPASSGVAAICWNSVANKVYTADHNGGKLTVFDGATNQVLHAVELDDAPISLAYSPTGNKIYCGLDYGSAESFVVIDCLADTVVASCSLGAPANYLAYNP
jgi:DNA-binding beta-propeller fold protein YncE